MAFIDGFCSISPKIISLRRNKTHEMLSTNLVSSQKTSDARCCQFLFLFHFFFFIVFGRERAGAIYLGPYYTKVRNLKYNIHQQRQLKTLFKFVFSQAFYVLTSFISAEIMRKFLSAELRQRILS